MYQVTDISPNQSNLLSDHIRYVDDKKNMIANILCNVQDSMQLNNARPTNAYAGMLHLISLCIHIAQAIIDVDNVKYIPPSI